MWDSGGWKIGGDYFFSPAAKKTDGTLEGRLAQIATGRVSKAPARLPQKSPRHPINQGHL
jgi:hypothetical protein